MEMLAYDVEPASLVGSGRRAAGAGCDGGHARSDIHGLLAMGAKVTVGGPPTLIPRHVRDLGSTVGAHGRVPEVAQVLRLRPLAEVGGVDGEAALLTKPREKLSVSFTLVAECKIVTDPYVGRLAYIRVYSGKISTGQALVNTARRNQRERIGRLVRMHANSREEIEEVLAGDIAAIIGPKNTFTGDTLCDAGQPVVLESIKFPEPVISVAIAIVPLVSFPRRLVGMFHHGL